MDQLDVRGLLRAGEVGFEMGDIGSRGVLVRTGVRLRTSEPSSTSIASNVADPLTPVVRSAMETSAAPASDASSLSVPSSSTVSLEMGA